MTLLLIKGRLHALYFSIVPYTSPYISMPYTSPYNSSYST